MAMKKCGGRHSLDLAPDPSTLTQDFHRDIATVVSAIQRHSLSDRYASRARVHERKAD